MDIKIEKGIEMPAKQSMNKVGPTAQTLLSMEVGDSFLAQSNGDKKTYSVYWFKKKHPAIKFASRKTAEGIRIWRIE